MRRTIAILKGHFVGGLGAQPAFRRHVRARNLASGRVSEVTNHIYVIANSAAYAIRVDRNRQVGHIPPENAVSGSKIGPGIARRKGFRSLGGPRGSQFDPSDAQKGTC